MAEKIRLVKIDELKLRDIASICDHTFLNRTEAFREKAKEGERAIELREEAFERFLRETVNFPYAPYAVCIRPEDVGFVKTHFGIWKKESIVIAAVAGFPDGSRYSTEFKLAETELAIKEGAREIDFVLNTKKFKQEYTNSVKDEKKEVAKLAHENRALVKLILETSELRDYEIRGACKMAEENEVDFVKTSTGFSAYGARAEDLKIMRENFSRGIKISGGVNVKNLKELLYAASGRTDSYIELDPLKIRIGESSLLNNL